MPAFIRLDLFPARVELTREGLEEPVVHQNVRATVTDDEIYLYTDSMQGPLQFYRASLIDISRAEHGYVVYTAHLDDGLTASITRSGGCGCGSRLRAFNAFPSVPHEAWR